MHRGQLVSKRGLKKIREIHKLRSSIGGGSSEIVVGPNLTIEGAKRPRIAGEAQARGRKLE